MASRGITAFSIWCGLAAALYVSGFESLHQDAAHRARRWWQALALAGPLFLAFVMNTGAYLTSVYVLGGLLLVWAVLAWWVLERPGSKHGGRRLNFFVCGIVLVDMLAVCPAPAGAWSAAESIPRDLFLFFGFLFVSSLSLTIAQAWTLALMEGKRGREANAVGQNNFSGASS